MDTGLGDCSCLIDRDGVIVWASPGFVALFSHRASPVGMMLNQLFAGLVDVCRHGATLEDRDRIGRRRYFQAVCHRIDNARGDRVSDVVVLRDVTMMRMLSDISRLATQAKTPRDFLERTLWLMKEVCGYLGLAGFVSRGEELELLASKGWTEKLKSMIRIVPIAPDAPAMAGRCAYHREQMVTTIQEYGLMPTVKDAIERIGGEFVVVTPLIDHDRLAGVLTVIHSRALTPEELETLEAVCGQIAVSLNVRLTVEELGLRAGDAGLLMDLLATEARENNAVIRAWAERPGDRQAGEDARRAMLGNDEAAASVRAISASGNFHHGALPLAEAIDMAAEDARMVARLGDRRLNVSVTLRPGARDASVGPLLRYALRIVLIGTFGQAGAGPIDVDVRASRDRAGALKIEASDNGPGIPDEMKSEVFRHESIMGPGISLYLVKKIVGRHGGRAWVEDRVPGNPSRGARVVIVLPPGQQHVK